MHEKVKSRWLSLAAIGAGTLSLAGCGIFGWADNRSFVFSCGPETPVPKVSSPHYIDVPNSHDNKTIIDVSCINPLSGKVAAPLRIDAGSQPFNGTQPGEQQYKFDITFDHNLDSGYPPLRVGSIALHNPKDPGVAVITMRGMYGFEQFDQPAAISSSS